ncbi:hypothetical protein H0H93_009572, partial [Arthromyces matolae]
MPKIELQFPDGSWDLQLRERTVKQLEECRGELDKWISGTDQWVLEEHLMDLQKRILEGLRYLTTLDIRHPDFPSTLPAYKPVILNRMLVALQMHENPLAWGRYKTILESDIQSVLTFYDTVMKENYWRHGYHLHDYKTLTEEVESDLKKEREKG